MAWRVTEYNDYTHTLIRVREFDDYDTARFCVALWSRTAGENFIGLYQIGEVPIKVGR